MQASERTVFIHVGEGKVGSSTIQRACVEGRERLAAAGIDYPLNDVWWSQHAEIARELGGNESSASLDLLAELLARTPGRVLLSSEFFSRLKLPAIRRLAALLDGRPVRVVMYLRPYPTWTVSLYGQATKRGGNTADWDAYVQRYRRPSCADRALRWATVFGASSVRVRTTHPDDLIGGGLLSDFAAFVDVPLSVTADANRSPSWVALESARWMAAQDARERHDPARRRAVRRLVSLVEPAAAGHPRAQYLTPEQSDGLAARWERDLGGLGEALGRTFPVGEVRVADPRPFLPTVHEVPEAVTGAVGERVAEPRVREAIPDAELALIERFAARDF